MEPVVRVVRRNQRHRIAELVFVALAVGHRFGHWTRNPLVPGSEPSSGAGRRRTTLRRKNGLSNLVRGATPKSGKRSTCSRTRSKVWSTSTWSFGCGRSTRVCGNSRPAPGPGSSGTTRGGSSPTFTWSGDALERERTGRSVWCFKPITRLTPQRWWGRRRILTWPPSIQDHRRPEGQALENPRRYVQRPGSRAEAVFAIGNPFGLSLTMTKGIISALDREIDSPSGASIPGAIQTDAPINPGNSGGPLLDKDGRLIGVNSSIATPSGGNVGIGFAILGWTRSTPW